MAAFLHGVANGDPLTDAVVIWTRVPSGDGHGLANTVPVRWTVAADEALRSVVASGETVALAEHDGTLSVEVHGLRPGTHYWYAFDASGERSPVGRTLTLRRDGLEHLRFVSVSCAKFNAGFFNGYARIGDRDDIDFVLHLGDCWSSPATASATWSCSAGMSTSAWRWNCAATRWMWKRRPLRWSS